MKIVADFGNTRCKVGMFHGSECLGSRVIVLDELADVLNQNMPEQMMYCTVRPIESTLLSEWESICPVLKLTHQSRLPVKIQYNSPETLGMDRLAAVCGAQLLFPGKNVLVVDAGTCITYDFLDENGVYHGGSISPGLRMRLRAMHELTGSLPQLDFEFQDKWPGTDTKTSMLSGVHWGVLGEYLEMERQMHAINDNLISVFTGGDAPFFEKVLKKEIFADPNLVLTGLNHILLQNAL